jgi:uncharacterized membrane protein
MSDAALRLGLGAISLTGLWAALTMTGAYYGWWRGPVLLVPERLCSPRVGGCLDILATPYARLFGPPNSALGILYYLLLIALSITGLGWLAPPARLALTILAWGVVLFSVYLAWSLIFRLRTNCVLCFLSHILNLAIALLLALAPSPAAL